VSVIFRGIRAEPARLLVALVILFVLAAGLLASVLAPNGAAAFIKNGMEYLRQAGLPGLLLFSAVQILLVVSGAVPSSLIGIAAGALYGLLPGFLLSAFGCLLGAIIAFWLSRSLFRSQIQRLLARSGRLRNLDRSVSKDGWKFVLLLRLSPVMPFSVRSDRLGLSSVRLWQYAVGTLASLPALFGYVFAGSLADAGLSAWVDGTRPFRWALIAIGAVATLALGAYLGRILARRDIALELAEPQGAR